MVKISRFPSYVFALRTEERDPALIKPANDEPLPYSGNFLTPSAESIVLNGDQNLSAATETAKKH